MATLERALQIAAQAHEGQRDKGGQPYVTHPLRVLGRVEGDEARIAAVLHDVVEDTAVTLEDLRRAGFAAAVLDAVDRLTRRPGQPYADYVIACKADAVARQVKLADLEDNAQLARVLLRPDRPEADLARLHRYVFSYKFLTDRLTEGEYRRLMAAHG